MTGCVLRPAKTDKGTPRQQVLAWLNSVEFPPEDPTAWALARPELTQGVLEGQLRDLLQQRSKQTSLPLVALALGRFGSRNSTQDLIVTLDSNDYHLQWRSAEALGRIQANSAVPKLIEVLMDPIRELNVRVNACAALGAIGDPRAKPALVEIADTPKEFGLAGHARHALSKIN